MNHPGAASLVSDSPVSRYRIARPGVAHGHRILYVGTAHHHAGAVDQRLGRHEAAILARDGEAREAADASRIASRSQPRAGVIEQRPQPAAFARNLAEHRTGVFQTLLIRDGPSRQREPPAHLLLVL